MSPTASCRMALSSPLSQGSFVPRNRAYLAASPVLYSLSCTAGTAGLGAPGNSSAGWVHGILQILSVRLGKLCKAAPCTFCAATCAWHMHLAHPTARVAEPLKPAEIPYLWDNPPSHTSCVLAQSTQELCQALCKKAAELAQGGTTPSQMALASSYTTFFFLKGNSHVMVTDGLFPCPNLTLPACGGFGFCIETHATGRCMRKS